MQMKTYILWFFDSKNTDYFLLSITSCGQVKCFDVDHLRDYKSVLWFTKFSQSSLLKPTTTVFITSHENPIKCFWTRRIACLHFRRLECNNLTTRSCKTPLEDKLCANSSLGSRAFNLSNRAEIETKFFALGKLFRN